MASDIFAKLGDIKGDSLDELTPGRAAELLADRRGVAPAKKPRRVAKAAKKKR